MSIFRAIKLSLPLVVVFMQWITSIATMEFQEWSDRGTKADWLLNIHFETATFNMLANTLEINLYRTLQHATGRQSFIVVWMLALGMRGIFVMFGVAEKTVPYQAKRNIPWKHHHYTNFKNVDRNPDYTYQDLGIY